jgi:hypothetical protein
LNPSITVEHYPPRSSDPLDRQPSARTAEEAAFLGLGAGAAQWLGEAAEEERRAPLAEYENRVPVRQTPHQTGPDHEEQDTEDGDLEGQQDPRVEHAPA